ncbi:cobalt-precorrin-5B (C(1))-methyltransferase [Formosa sediminum]|uniref:Cobalt-precorrin-5B C(1)-methyltransferase n=1 Tax=Formosa sediminum TaxID=2594004 RepID=A0A516GSD5_9FLAO|nr:cobalt-precorrin-5B (C(1))-methyltransferase CbiD [Formosa sediminum]QDO94418.1 cobalt-precorrin-5B (C(1))-methyltransferase [Formosa sediminum]
MGLRKVPEGPLRDGFTTGTCATAAAKSGLMAIIHQKKITSVKVHLPVDKIVEIPIHQCVFTESTSNCSVIKDAGDDPDVTNGAEIGCVLELIQEKDIKFIAGEGVGTVTLKGLELAIGEPAINPVPRKMITNAIQKLLHDYDLECGVSVTVYVTNGRKIAKRTLNERVGIMNGISILGTSGIVKPYSSSSYIASIEQGIDVAVANKITELVINSGARSEKFLRDKFTHLPEYGFIHYGNWIGETLNKINRSPIKKVSIGIMLGKAVKLAGGIIDTHSCVSSWNKDFVVNLAQQVGYNDVNKIKDLNMAGRLIELFDFKQNSPFFQLLLAHCYKHTQTKIKQVDLEIYLIHKNGTRIKFIKK